MADFTRTCPGCGAPRQRKDLLACPACFAQLPRELQEQIGLTWHNDRMREYMIVREKALAFWEARAADKARAADEAAAEAAEADAEVPVE